MVSFIKVLWIALLLGLLALAGTVAAEVDWTDSVSDPAGDVEDMADVPYPNRADVDIIMVSITEEGDNINVTMVMAGEYNSSGTYSISVSADGADETYDFSKIIFLGFSVTDPSQASVDVEGYVSADGTILSWVVAKSDITVTDSLDIETAMSMVMDFTGSGPTLFDYAGFSGPTDIPVPAKMEVSMGFDKLNVLQMTVVMTYSGDDAKGLRTSVDENADGTVSDTEYNTFVDQMDFDEPEDPSEANVTYDGKDPTDLTSNLELQGLKGAVDSTADVKFVITMKVTFPKAEDKDSHVIVFKEAIFGEDFIGGDEPWENQFDMVFKFSAPDGWKFKGDSLPAKMKDYTNKDGDEVKMENADIRADWNSTFRQLTSFTIEKSDDGSPGFGLLMVVAAITVVAALATTRRRK